MRLLIDTHALLWFAENAIQLSEPARRAIEDPGNQCFVSIATGWEMAIKTGLGKLTLPLPFSDLFPTGLERLGFDILPIQAAHLHQLPGLPLHHRDPFDRMLIAQALCENLIMVGNDVAFDTYGVRRIW